MIPGYVRVSSGHSDDKMQAEKDSLAMLAVSWVVTAEDGTASTGSWWLESLTVHNFLHTYVAKYV